MKKIIKFLFVLIIIGIVMIFTVPKYIEEENNISKKLGAVWSGGAISTNNYYVLRNISEWYINTMSEKNYESAYSSFTYNYTEYKDFDTFCMESENIDFNNYLFKNIIRRTENLYSVFFENGALEKEILILVNEDLSSYYIIPEPFIEYKKVDNIIKKKNVSYEVISTVNFIDEFIVNLKLTNHDKNDEVNISSIELDNGSEHLVKGDIKSLILKSLKTKEISIKFKTSLDIPTQLIISRTIGRKQKIENYLFDI